MRHDLLSISWNIPQNKWSRNSFTKDAEIDTKAKVDDFGTIDILYAEGFPDPPVPDFVPISVGEA